MKKIDNMLLVAVVAVLGMANLAGLGNAAHDIERWYWIPFVLNIVFYLSVCVMLFKNNEKPKTQGGEGSGAAHPAPGEHEKEDTVTDK